MARNVLDHLPGHRKVLILVGYSHVAELTGRVANAGFAADSFDRAEKRELFSIGDRSAKFPPGLEAVMRKSVDLFKQELDRETDPDWRTAFERGIALRQKLLDQIAITGESKPAPVPLSPAAPAALGKTH
jgi:hypothetical protein